jgi:hypothetical protein
MYPPAAVRRSTILSIGMIELQPQRKNIHYRCTVRSKESRGRIYSRLRRSSGVLSLYNTGK